MENDEMTNDAAVACHRVRSAGYAGYGVWRDGDIPIDEAQYWESADSSFYIERAYSATTVAELRARIVELEANDRRYRFLRDGDGEVFWQDAYEAIGSAFVGSHIDSLIDEAMDRLKADQEDDSP